jgi:hypothetical protein
MVNQLAAFCFYVHHEVLYLFTPPWSLTIQGTMSGGNGATLWDAAIALTSTLQVARVSWEGVKVFGLINSGVWVIEVQADLVSDVR